MYYLKGCKRCGGDLYMENDGYGAYIGCFQCGAIVADFGENLPKGLTVSDALEMAAAASQKKSA
ncbi:MAG: hypothetical protein L0177_13955 [Chloroflexi bacterium]|nr:hypothetical protein [Chloroflexota bacterium]